MKKLLIAAGAVVGILIVAAAALPFLISADAYKGEILSRIHDATGREMRIAGPLSLSVFPNIAVEARDAALANASGGESADMLRVEKLDLALKLMPLLSGRIEIDHFTLVNPTIALEIDAQGRPNWDFGGVAPTGTTPASPGSQNVAAGLAALSRLRIGDLKIENGTITFSDRRSGLKQEVQQADVTVSLPSLQEPFAATGSVRWHGEKVAATMRIDEPGAAMPSKGSSAFAASADAKFVAVSVKGKISNGGTAEKPDFAVDGDADVKMVSARDFARWVDIGMALPPNGLGPLAISGKVHATPDAARFSDANFSLDALKAKGELDVTFGAARPLLKGRLAAEQLDLNPYLPPVRRSGGSIWNEAAIDVEPLKIFDADLDVAAQGMRYRQLKIGKTALTIHLASGKLALDINEMAFYDGHGRGKIEVDANTAPPPVALNLVFSSVQLGALQRDTLGAEQMRGAGSFEFSGSGRGASQREVVATLAGKGNFHMANANVGGVDFNGMFKNATSSFQNRGGGETTITQASGAFTLNRGVMRNSDLVVKTESINATGTGTVNLMTRAVDYRVTPEILAGLVTVPVTITGTWDNLSFQPDVSGIAKGIVQTPVKVLGGAAEAGGGVAKGVGGALQGLFGK